MLILIFANGSLFKQEVIQLMARHGFKDSTEIEEAIVQLTLHHYIQGAPDNKEKMEAAVRTIQDDPLPNKRLAKQQEKE